MYADMHVHFRDEEQSYKETIAHGLEVARDSGVSVVGDMPNTKRPVVDEERLLQRFELARSADIPEVAYGVYIGVTANPEQIRRAVEITRKYSFKKNSRFFVAGLKWYLGESVGDLAVINPEEQFLGFETLSAEGFDGVLGIHAESEKCMYKGKWDPKNPVTHCIARPYEAEVESVNTVVDFAKRTKLKAKIEILHVSVPESVGIIHRAKTEDGLDISSGTCPHYIVFDYNVMNSPDGLLYKMNPPLRPFGMNVGLIALLREGKIPRMETDHAPHGLKEKTESPYMSGIPGLANWPTHAEFLRRNNFTEKQIEDLTFNNALNRFGIDVDKNRSPRKNRAGDYAFNPYGKLEAELRA